MKKSKMLSIPTLRHNKINMEANFNDRDAPISKKCSTNIDNKEVLTSLI